MNQIQKISDLLATDDTGTDVVPTSGPLARALAARSNAEFNTELGNLAKDTGMSIREIARAGNHKIAGFSPSNLRRHLIAEKKDQLFAREDQLRLFVETCNVSRSEAELWVQAWKNLSEGRLPSGQRRHPIFDLTPLFGGREDERVNVELRLKVTESTLNSMMDTCLAALPTLATIAGAEQLHEWMRAKSLAKSARFAVGPLSTLAAAAVFLLAKPVMRGMRLKVEGRAGASARL